MNKNLTKIAALSVSLAMAIGVGVALGVKNSVRNVRADGSYTLTFTANSSKDGSGTTLASDGSTALTAANFFTSGTNSFKVSGTTYYWLVGGYNDVASVSSTANCYPGKNSTLKVGKSAGDGTVSFTVVGDSTLSIDSVSITAFGAADTVKITVDEATDATKTWNLTTSSNSHEFVYKEGVKTVSITGGAGLTSSNKVAYISQIVINYSTGAPLPKTEIWDTSWKVGENDGYWFSSTVDLYQFFAYEAGATELEPEQRVVVTTASWTSSDTTVATIRNGNNGVGLLTCVKPGTTTLTATASGYDECSVEIEILKGSLSSIAVSGAMTKTNYTVNSSWDPAGLVVTATWQYYEDDVTADVEWSFNPTTPSAGITSVVATATYESEQADSDPQSVTVIEGTTYDLSTITNFSSWTTSYGVHNLTNNDFTPSVDTAAALNFKITNKQSSGVGSTYPCIGAKTTTEMECLTFTLTEIGKKITSVEIVFVTRYTNTFPSLYLHKGSGVASAAISSLTMSGAQASEHSLTCNNLNDTVFTVGYNANQTGSNGAVGIKSISIGLTNQAAFGTLDHISITGMPNNIYHVGELFNSTGFVVTAYDGANEATANFKDVTADVDMLIDDTYEFVDRDVPGLDVDVEYTESGTTKETSFHIYVYALAEYELVTSAPADWSGSYLIVATNAESDFVAMDGSLANPDVAAGYKVVTESADVITAGQELEWTISAVTGGYSIQGKSGKYIGSLTTASNGMLVSESSLVNTLSYSDDNAVVSGTNGYGLSFNADGNRFRYYKDGTVALYRLKQSSNADAFAQTFLGAFTCDATGSSEPSFAIKEGSTYWSWALLAVEYDTLTSAEKEEFRLGVASESGDNIAQALARYDYIVGKYGVAKYADFMVRNPQPINNGVPFNANNYNQNNGNTMIIIVSVIAVVSVASIAVLLVIKKRKHN